LSKSGAGGARNSSAVQSATEQIEACIRNEDLVQAQSLLQQALRTYPGETQLLTCQKHLEEEQVRVRRTLWSKILDDAVVNMGRLRYKQAADILGSVDWASGDLPDLAEKAEALLAEANQHLRETAQHQTVVRAPVASPQPPEGAELLSAQERLRAALQAGGPKEELSATRVSPAPPMQEPVAGVETPVRVPAIPKPRPVAPPVAPPKRSRAALYAGVSVLVLVLAAVAAWHFLGTGARVGYVQLSSTPWAEIQSIKTAAGKAVHLTGQTPPRSLCRPDVTSSS
jgi:hypothetical protein